MIDISLAQQRKLTYLLSCPDAARPGYGLVTNGSEFLFLKQVGTLYATSNLWSIVNEGNDLVRVLQVLRRLA
jgi:hypothetical protein